MAFVVEKIATPKQRAEFDSFKFTYPASQRPLESRRWVVDRTRGLFFVCIGVASIEMPAIFRLVSSEGIWIDCEALKEVEGKGEIYPDGVAVTWNVSSILIPKAHAGRSDEILAWLREAFLAYGYLGDPELTKSSAVNLPAPRFV